MSISNFILKKLGWTHHVDIEIPPKAVICIAPHTSNYDFIFGQLFAKANNIKASFFIKDTWFFFPMNLFFKALGGIPVNRSKKTSMTSRIAEAIKKEDKALLAITPEGTRQANPEWKKGFYYIALEAGIPILLAHIDFKKKEMAITKQIMPTGDIDKELKEIKAHYQAISGKHPERFETGL